MQIKNANSEFRFEKKHILAGMQGVWTRNDNYT